jgi:eukaryotic-like serine/threonine-protein kinase
MTHTGAESDLLFGLLALKIALVDEAKLLAAFLAWTRDKSRTLAEHLVARGDLEPDDCSVVMALAARHLKKHGSDERESLAALAIDDSTRSVLAQVSDSALQASLAQTGAHGLSPDKSAGRTASYAAGDARGRAASAVGTPTSDGQRFRILRSHAQGGLGAIFVALDEELNREVALKQILGHHADDSVSRARFVIEAEITGGLEHPGIVPVYGLGTYPDGRPYYAMRFIRGDSLKEAIAQFHADESLKNDLGRRSLALHKLLRRFLDVCNAIEYAHSRGVLHRDIKPANIVVGQHGETLVVDWGLAKATGRVEPGADGPERPLLPCSASGSAETIPGSALGTPAYMSPEQALGQLDRLSVRSDVYSLGATLYSLLTGDAPFAGELGAVLRAVQRGEFQPPRQREPSIDPALEAVCLKAMALQEENRYASPGALREDVERWLADEPVTAWREPLPRRLRRWARRNRTTVTGAAVAVIAGVIGLGAVLGVQTQANTVLTEANRNLAIANAKVNIANIDLQAANERERQRFDLAMDAIKLFHGDVSEDLLLREKPFEKLRGKLLTGAAKFYGRLENLLARQTDAASREALGRAYDELATLTFRIGNMSQALDVRRKGLQVWRELAAQSDATLETRLEPVRNLIAIGQLQEQLASPAETLASLDEARSIAERSIAEDGATVPAEALLARVHDRIAQVLDGAGRRDESMASNRKALAIRQSLVDANPNDEELRRDLADSHAGIGSLVALAGQPGDALASYNQALAIRQALAKAHPDNVQHQADLAASQFQIGELQWMSGRMAEGLASLEKGLAIRQVLAESNPTLTRFQNNLANSLLRVGVLLEVRGRLSEALGPLEKGRAILESLVAANPNVVVIQSSLAGAHTEIAQTLNQLNRPSEAMASYEKARAIIQALAKANPGLVQVRSNLAVTLGRIGTLHESQGRVEPATAAYREAIAILEQHPSREIFDLYNLACFHARLAGVLGRPGSPERAALATAAADRAMIWLRQAVAAGLRDLNVLRNDADLAALHSRGDFQLLMMDLAMPDKPFEPARR